MISIEETGTRIVLGGAGGPLSVSLLCGEYDSRTPQIGVGDDRRGSLVAHVPPGVNPWPIAEHHRALRRRQFERETM